MAAGLGLKRRDTATLVLQADCLAAACIAIVTVGNWKGIWEKLSGPLRVAGVLGAALVLVRFFALLKMRKLFQRWKVTNENVLSLPGDPQALNKETSAIDDAAEHYITEHPRMYRGVIALGLLGYWLLVSSSGGPFISPFAPLLLAAFFLGMIRADTQKSIDYLLAAAFAAILLSASISEGMFDKVGLKYESSLHFDAWSYVPAAVVVGLATYWVNKVNFRERVRLGRLPSP